MKTLRQAYNFCACCGARLEARNGYSACTNGSCGHREFFNPRPNVSAALLVEKAKILLVKRAKEPGRGLWELPGGFQQEGESLEETLRREVVNEELSGIVIDDIEYLHSGYADYPFGELIIPVSTIVFRANVVSLENVELSDEGSEMGFFKQDAIPWQEIAFATDSEAIRKL